MPTSTVPFEILFEFSNNNMEPATMQVLRQEDSARTGATVLLHRGENISLVLTAGSSYKYAVRQGGVEATLCVKVWKDTRCNLSDIFIRSKSTASKGSDTFRTIAEGVTVVSLVQHRTHLDR